MADGNWWDIHTAMNLSRNRRFIQNVIRKEFAYDILFGSISNDDVSQYAAIMPLEMLPTVVMVLQVDNDNRSCFDKEVLRARRCQVYDKIVFMLNQDAVGLITVMGSDNILAVMVGDREVAILLPVNLKNEETVIIRQTKSYGRYIKSYLEKDLDFSITLAIGRCGDFLHIRNSYQEACQALQYKFYQGNSSLLHINDLVWSERASQQVFLEYETALLVGMRSGNWSSVADTGRKLLQRVAVNRQTQPVVLKVRILEMLTVMSRAAMELGAAASVLLDIKLKAGEEISAITTMDEMENWLVALLGDICALLQEKHQANALRAVMQARQYINENYTWGISLEEVARQVLLSPFYLSHAFTELTGMSFTDYLKTVRIHQAQSLLLTTNKAVAEVATSVGYQDPNYFSRVFRIATGKSPQQYRRGNA
jgi:two-component system response regulator YesN